jgi:hypothetical protein
VLLFSSTLRTGADFEPALRERGLEVLRASSTRSLERHLQDPRVQLVLLDCPSARETERAVAILDGGRSVPRIWVSSSSDAPMRSGHLGVDALLIDPDDVVAVIASVERFLAPWANVSPPRHGSVADGTNPPRPRPRGTGPVAGEAQAAQAAQAAAELPDERDPSTSWDEPTSDYKLRLKTNGG